MNTTPEQQKRIAIILKPDRATVGWVLLDQTGQPPKVIDNLIDSRLELVSLDDSPIAIYRADTDESYTREALTVFAELVKVVNGEPNVSVDVDEQMRQLREQLRATTENAQEMILNRDQEIDYLQHRVEKIIEQARRWKGIARRREQYIDSWKDEDRKLRSAITQRDTELRASRREIAELQDQLQVARNAVERSVNRSNHSNEHVDKARERAHVAETNAARHAQEAADVRQQLGQATAEAHDLRERIVGVQANALETINRVAATLPEPIIPAEIVEPEFEIVTYFSEDGNVPVVEIDSSAYSDRIRIILNDGPLFDGLTEEDDRPGRFVEPLQHEPAVAPRQNSKSTISRALDTIRDQAEKIEELAERADAWEKIYRHPALRQFTEEDGVAFDQVHGGISRLSEWRETIREQYVAAVAERDDARRIAQHAEDLRQKAVDERDAAIRQATARQASIEALQAERDALREDYHRRGQQIEVLRAERDKIHNDRALVLAQGEKARTEWAAEVDRARADNEKLREINELQRQGIDALATGASLQRKLEAVGGTESQMNAALRIISVGAMTYADARALVPDDTDPLRYEQNRRWIAESETMRKRLDEQLATERRAYETTSAALRAMLRERDHVINLAAEEIESEGLTARAFENARRALPKLEAEEDARDGGLVDVIRQYDGLVQIGANLARAVIESDPTSDNRHTSPNVQLAEYYEREHDKLKR